MVPIGGTENYSRIRRLDKSKDLNERGYSVKAQSRTDRDKSMKSKGNNSSYCYNR